MSDVKFSANNTSNLVQRLQSVEKSLEFIQREHASTLSNLHEEIAKWQQKCSDLSFQIAIGGTVTNTETDNKLRATIEKLQSELDQCKSKVEDLNRILAKKEKVLKDYENRLLVNDRKHALELHAHHHKQRELKSEFEQRSALVAQLTNQLHSERQQQQKLKSRMHFGKVILPDKPSTFKSSDVQQQQSLSLSFDRQLPKHSTSFGYPTISGSDPDFRRVLIIGRRALTPPQRLKPIKSKSVEQHDDPSNTKRHRQLLNTDKGQVEVNESASSRPSLKCSTILPPIINRKIPLRAFATTTLQPEGQA